MTQQERAKLIMRANGCRKVWGMPIDRGLVYFAQGRPTGWIADLTAPEAHHPGVIAVDPHGGVYEALDGDWQDGARRWGVVQ